MDIAAGKLDSTTRSEQTSLALILLYWFVSFFHALCDSMYGLWSHSKLNPLEPVCLCWLHSAKSMCICATIESGF